MEATKAEKTAAEIVIIELREKEAGDALGNKLFCGRCKIGTGGETRGEFWRLSEPSIDFCAVDNEEEDEDDEEKRRR